MNNLTKRQKMLLKNINEMGCEETFEAFIEECIVDAFENNVIDKESINKYLLNMYVDNFLKKRLMNANICPSRILQY